MCRILISASLLLLLLVTRTEAQLLSGAPGVLRAYSLLGGVVTGDLPGLPSLPTVARTSYGAPTSGCNCMRGPPGGKCCNFINRIPPVGTQKKEACTCRRCAPAYRCVAHKSPTWCIRRRIKAVPKCVDFRAPHEQCVLVPTNFDILVPYARTATQPKVDTRPSRPTTYDVFVAGHMMCDVFQGRSTTPILKTTVVAKVYQRLNVQVKKCAPIRLRCRDTSRNRLGVMVALRAEGKYYGTGLSSTKCAASPYQPKMWHSDNPRPKDEKEIINDSPYEDITWKEMTELTGVRPIRARQPFRSIYTYVVVTPPFCASNFKGPIA